MAEFDAIVIGSGFGGAVSAARLAEQGLKVLVLERGRRWQPEDYPREPGDAWLWDSGRPHKLNGWVDIDAFGDMSVARGAGVGGGSLIYASVSIVPPPERFDEGWPEAISHEGLLPYYERVGRMLNVQPLPQNQLTRRYHLMKEAAGRLGYGARFRPVELAVTFDPEWSYEQQDCFSDSRSRSWVNAQGQTQGTCTHCANCDAGCQVRAKNTLDLNYIPLAEQHGAEVRPLHLVRNIAPVNGGYEVLYDRLDSGTPVRGSVTARKVILAAGSLGSTEILLRARDQYKTLPLLSRRLGHGWSANGDFVTPSFHRREISASQGPTISAAIDLLDGVHGGAPLFIEDGGFPDLLGNYLEEVLKRWHRPNSPWGWILQALALRVRSRDPLDKVMLWFGQAVDAGDGQVRLRRPWYAPWRRNLALKWDIRRSEQVMDAMADLHAKLARATDGVPFTPPTWTLFKDLITPHPLGGCNMGDNAESGVVDHKGEVFGYPGLHVLDGAIIPRPLGLNPSRTIAALAERAVEVMGRA